MFRSRTDRDDLILLCISLVSGGIGSAVVATWPFGGLFHAAGSGLITFASTFTVPAALICGIPAFYGLKSRGLLHWSTFGMAAAVAGVVVGHFLEAMRLIPGSAGFLWEESLYYGIIGVAGGLSAYAVMLKFDVVRDRP